MASEEDRGGAEAGFELKMKGKWMRETANDKTEPEFIERERERERVREVSLGVSRISDGTLKNKWIFLFFLPINFFS